MGARQWTSVSKKASVATSLKRSAPTSSTRNGRLPVVSMSRATNSASSSEVLGPTSGASTAYSSHSLGCSAPRGFKKSGRAMSVEPKSPPSKRQLAAVDCPENQRREQIHERSPRDRDKHNRPVHVPDGVQRRAHYQSSEQRPPAQSMDRNRSQIARGEAPADDRQRHLGQDRGPSGALVAVQRDQY